MLDALVKETIKANEPNETMKQYDESVKRFEELVKTGVAKKRENQLLVNLSDIKFNI